MQKSKARTLVRVLLGLGIVIGLISRFILEDVQLKTTFHNISLGMICGAFLFVVLAFIMPRWFMDKPKNEGNKF